MAVRTVVPKGCVEPADHRSDVPVGRIAPRKVRHVMRTATLLWTSSVYEPEVRDTLPVHAIALADSEEAVESVNLEWSRNDRRERLACDGVVIYDARVLALGQPSLGIPPGQDVLLCGRGRR